MKIFLYSVIFGFFLLSSNSIVAQNTSRDLSKPNSKEVKAPTKMNTSANKQVKSPTSINTNYVQPTNNSKPQSSSQATFQDASGQKAESDEITNEVIKRTRKQKNNSLYKKSNK